MLCLLFKMLGFIFKTKSRDGRVKDSSVLKLRQHRDCSNGLQTHLKQAAEVKWLPRTSGMHQIWLPALAGQAIISQSPEKSEKVKRILKSHNGSFLKHLVRSSLRSGNISSHIASYWGAEARAFRPLAETGRWAVIWVQENKFFISFKERCLLSVSTSLFCWASHWYHHHHIEHIASLDSAFGSKSNLTSV